MLSHRAGKAGALARAQMYRVASKVPMTVTGANFDDYFLFCFTIFVRQRCCEILIFKTLTVVFLVSEKLSKKLSNACTILKEKERSNRKNKTMMLFSDIDSPYVASFSSLFRQLL